MSTVKAINLQHPSSANANLVTDSSGRIGIGTSSPGVRLDVVQDFNDTIIRSKSTTAGAWITADSAADGYHGLRLAAAGVEKWLIGSDGTTSMKIARNGYGGNTFFSVDASGRVNMPGQPGFYAYRTDGSYTPGAGALVYNNTTFNTGSNFSTSTGRFTAPVAGMYYFHHQQYFRGTYAFRSGMYKNGNLFAVNQGSRGTGDGEWTSTLTQLVYLAANDYIYCGLINTGELFMAVDHSWFCGYLIG